MKPPYLPDLNESFKHKNFQITNIQTEFDNQIKMNILEFKDEKVKDEDKYIIGAQFFKIILSNQRMAQN